MTWRSKIRWWVARWIGAAIFMALAVGLLWVALRNIEAAGDASSTTAVGEAMSKAARQRELTT